MSITLPMCVIPNCYGRDWAVWRESIPHRLRGVSAVLQWTVTTCLFHFGQQLLHRGHRVCVTPAMFWCLASRYRMCSIYSTHFRMWLLLSNSRPLPEKWCKQVIVWAKVQLLVWDVRLLTTAPVGVHWDNFSLSSCVEIYCS